VRLKSDSGAITAEFAIALPAVVLVTVLLAMALGGSSRLATAEFALSQYLFAKHRGEDLGSLNRFAAERLPSWNLQTYIKDSLFCVRAEQKAKPLGQASQEIERCLWVGDY
jgi:hypothetical protein